MIVVLQNDIKSSEKSAVAAWLEGHGYTVREIEGEKETVLGAVGSVGLDPRQVEVLPGVARVIPITKPYKLASRELKKDDTVFNVGPVKVGGDRIVVIAGPCAVESEEQILAAAAQVRESGAVMLRGGAFKPRTSPYSFQGLGEEGLRLLKAAGEAHGLPVVSEIVSTDHVDMMADYVDVYQIGARNMQNFELLKRVGKMGRPVILKRGLAATIEEWLMAAEYLLSSGTDDVILCERGIRTFETYTRNTLDLSAIPVVRRLCHLPVIVDPSHGTGLREKVLPMAMAGIAAGANGLIIEVHPDPDQAVSDGAQSLFPDQFEKLMRDLEVLSPLVSKEIARLPVDHHHHGKPVISGGANGDGSTVLVGFQGERGAYSEHALHRYFPEGTVEARNFPRFRDVFDAVLAGEVDWGVIPLENSLAGSVHDNYDLLALNADIRICGEVKIRVEHTLIGLAGSLDTVKRVYSHPQALSQCAEFLEKNGLEPIAFYDTAGAVGYVAEKKDPTKAAIASADAAEYHGLAILKEGIETNPRNYTRFAVIAREERAAVSEPEKASLLFATRDEAGALSRCLAVFATHGLNLTKLESRPILGNPWNYQFYVDVELPEKGAVLERATEELKSMTVGFRVLGTYRKA